MLKNRLKSLRSDELKKARNTMETYALVHHFLTFVILFLAILSSVDIVKEIMSGIVDIFKVFKDKN